MTLPGSVLITGCTDGSLGSAMAVEFQHQGLLVFATARNVKSMSQLEKLDNVTLLAMDVVETAQIQAAVDAVKKETGGTLTYLINNAGHSRYMPLLDEEIELAKKVYDTNFWGPIAMTKAFAPLLIKAKGTVVFTTSVAGHIYQPYIGIYAASKISEELVAETLRLELAPFQVKVLSIVAGACKSNIHTKFEDFKLPAGSLYAPVEETIFARARGIDVAWRIDGAVFARSVVTDILKGKIGKIWHGGAAGTIKLLSPYLPTSIMDVGLLKDTGLDILAKQNK